MENERDFTSTDLPNDGKDRFDEFTMGVKKKFRPDWLDSENTIFINKLNFITKNYNETHQMMLNLKSTVYDDHKLQLEESEIKVRDLTEEHLRTKMKLDSMENNLPRMIREMIDYYSEQKLNNKFEAFVVKKDFKEAMAGKMDFVMFNDWVKQQ